MKVNKLQLLNIMITAVVFGFVVLHFIPYFNFAAKNIPEGDYSIFNFVWWRPSYMKKFGEAVYGKLHFDLNKSTTFLVLTFVAAIGLIVLNITKPNSLATEIVGPIFCGLGLYGYLTNNMLRLQAEPTAECYIKNPGLFWPLIVLLILAAVLIILRLVCFVPYYMQEKNKKKARGY